MPIDTAEVRRIARLAQLELAAETVEQFRHQLERILDYVAVLDELDVESTAPTAHTLEQGAPLRADELGESLTVDQALANAPDAAAGHFRVPRVLKG